MKKATIRTFVTTTLEERWKQYLAATGKTENEFTLKQYAELEHKVYGKC